MPNPKRARKARPQREAESPPIPPLVRWWLRNMIPLLRGPSRPLPRFRRSQKHLRNAAIEVLEGMRACLDEMIEWLREERGAPELKKIRVEN